VQSDTSCARQDVQRAAVDRPSLIGEAALVPAIVGYVARIAQACIIESGIPSASPSPAAPGNVIAILAVRIARFSGRAVDALSRSDDPCRGGDSCCHGEDQDCAENSEFHLAFPSFCASSVVLASTPEQKTPGRPPIFPPIQERPSVNVSLGSAVRE